MKKQILFILAFASLLVATCTKEISPSKPSKPEVCDFGPLSNNSFRTAEEFEMARSGGGSTKLRDSDKDGVPDINDNCPRTRNSDQKDTDKDGIGDACDPYPYGNEPSVSSVLLLDFDGYNLPAGSAWNNGVATYCQPSGLLPEQIQTILDSVKKDFAKYNITVTTDENVYLAASVAKRMRVVVTTSSEIYPGVAGIAYVGSMFGGTPECFVFSNTMSFNTLRIRVAVSHESGHTVGLFHQAQWDANCNIVYTYKPCDYSTNSGPIMGSIGGSCLPLWWVGPTPTSCTTIQDDNAILTSKLGLK